MLATPESVDSSRASPESGVLAAEVFVLDPSLCNENSPARKIKSVVPNGQIEKLHITSFWSKPISILPNLKHTVFHDANIKNHRHTSLYYFIS
jgi:hypothetical protein